MPFTSESGAAYTGGGYVKNMSVARSKQPISMARQGGLRAHMVAEPYTRQSGHLPHSLN